MKTKNTTKRALVGASFEIRPRLTDGKKAGTVRVPADIYKRLKQISAYSGTSMAQIIACAIEGIEVPEA